MARDLSVVLVALLGLLATCECGRLAPSMAPASALSAAAPSPERAEELDLLFIQQATSGRLVMEGNSSRQGRLLLNGVSRHTIWFADRPGRSAGQVETAFFVGSNFTDAQGDWLAKPNAALYISKPGPQASTDTIVILTLSDPVFDDANGTLTYKVQIVPDNSRLGESGGAGRKGSLMASYLQVARDPTTPTMLSEVAEGELAFGSAALFIDDWHEGGSGGEGSGRGDSGGEGSGGRGWERGDRDGHRWGHRGWGWGWRWCSWGWGWCEGWGY